MTTATMTLNDRLVELGVLGDQHDKTIQQKGATLVNTFFMSFNGEATDETVANVLHYLTDIQVRDYALGIIDKYDAKAMLDTLNYLLDKAPTDSAFINAPACLLATFLYERGDTENAAITLTNAQNYYSLAILLNRVIKAGWPSTAFASMRNDLHPKVVAGIFGEEDE